MEYSFIKFQIRSYWPHDVTDANSHISFTFQGTMFMLTVLTQLIFLKMKNLKHLSYLSVSLGNMVNTNTAPWYIVFIRGKRLLNKTISYTEEIVHVTLCFIFTKWYNHLPTRNKRKFAITTRTYLNWSQE